MKLIAFVLLSVLAAASANCGCLKCSKHIGLANEYIAAPKFCGPVKILYRGHKFGEHNSCFPKKDDGLDYSKRGLGGYQEVSLGHYPITIQKPVVVPEVPVCVPLVGLKACIDRVVLPAPEPRHHDKHGPQITYTSGPLLDAFDVDEYAYDHHRPYSCGYESFLPLNPFHSESPKYFPKTRSKRHLPVVEHSYKFFMNMLPPFMKDPIKNAVNIMALTHPEKNKKKPKYLMYSPPRKNDIVQRKQAAMSLKEKILYNIQHKNKDNFRSLLRNRNQDVLTRSKLLRESERLNSEENDLEDWLPEHRASDIFDKYYDGQYYSQFNQHTEDRRSKKYNNRMKRSIIMDSEEFTVPFYQVNVEDYPEERYMIDDDEPDDIEQAILQKRNPKYFRDPREEILRRAIKDELRNFKKIDNGDKFGYNKMVPHSPIFHLLTFPLKFFRKFGNSKHSALTAVPKMIIGTKKYFREFGKNFKKHALDFASDVIGDFDHEPYENSLKDLFSSKRYRRNTVTNENITDNPNSYFNTNDVSNTAYDKQSFTDSVKQTEQKNVHEVNVTSDELNSDDLHLTENRIANAHKNFRHGSENKVRKKRYIVQVVDEDEVEEYLRRKLGKMFNISPHQRRPQYIEERHSEEETWTVQETSDVYKRRNSYADDHRLPNTKMNLQKVRPKVIIDNKGLPFMELNGFKRPIFFNKLDGSHKNYNYEETVGSSHFIPIDSSEEVNRDKIDHIIGYARNSNKKNVKTNDVPINTIKKKMSDLLHETDDLVHIDFWTYHEIYDDLLEIQYIKVSIVQDWKKIVMDKRINDYKSKVNLLGKFKSMQHIKDIAVSNIVDAMSKETSNSFLLGEFVKILIKLHKLQCIINKVVGCFEEKFKMGTKFDVQNEIKFVDFLAKLNFAGEKTRNDMIAKLKKNRDVKLQENIILLDKLKKSLINEDEACIEGEANLIWEIKNIEKMRMRTIEEMHQKLMDGYRIKKHMKILFDLTKRLQTCEKELKDECKKHNEITGSKEDSEEAEGRNKKKFNMEEFKQKWQEKIEKYKELMQEKKEKLRKKYKKESNEDE